MILGDVDAIYPEIFTHRYRDLRHELTDVVGRWLVWYTVVRRFVTNEDASNCDGAGFSSCYLLCGLSVVV